MWKPLQSDLTAAKDFVEQVEKNGGIPQWVQRFAGPFNDRSVRDVIDEFLSNPRPVVWQRWSRTYMDDGLGTMVIPNLYFEDGKPALKYCLFLSRPEESLRIGRSHVSKDAELSVMESKHVVNTPNVSEWKRQRRHITDAFLPHTVMSKFVIKLTRMSQEMCNNWLAELQAEAGSRESTIDVRSWMHHTALAMFINCMMGDDRAYSQPYAKPEAADLNMFARYEDDLEFADTTPINSIAPRSVFNLEGARRELSAKEAEQRLQKILSFPLKLIARGDARKRSGKEIGPLLERLMELEQEDVKLTNMIATLIAGHDTTAYTMQYCLMELARNPRIQSKARAEVNDIYDEIEQSGRNIEFSDIPRFTFVTKCICETLRMWNVASTVFPRVTTFDDTIVGRDGSDVKLPKGTKFSFWYYGQHHSQTLWGKDAMKYNPDRKWQPEELQQSSDPDSPLQGTSVTPCTNRFHPFSIPTRDCIGKNFALTEMRILIPYILRNFRLEIPLHSELKHVKPSVDDPIYCSWAYNISGPVQPHVLKLKVIPIRNSTHTSKL
eukprot:g5878.t1